MKRTVVLALIASALAMALSACTPVPAWQRGGLMRSTMQMSMCPLEGAMDTHVHRTREGMMGAEMTGGVSCGCN